MRALALLLLLSLSAAALAQKVVCIDPGHPSEVGIGTRGKKVTEVGFAWQMAKLVKQRLEKAGVKVVLTKSSERQMVTNRARAEIANKAKADLMLRLHCDAAAGSGFASYYPAVKGKSREGVRGPSDAVIRRSKALATVFHAALAADLKGKLKNNGLKTDRQTAIGAKQGALTGSIHSQVPVVLVEMLVLTNPKDEAFAASSKGRVALADALANATLKALL